MYDLLVYIGRFQLPHLGHEFVIQEAKKNAKRVLVLIGSAARPRSFRNPFNYGERRQMLQASLTPNDRDTVLFRPLPDTPYNDVKWVQNVQSVVSSVANDYGATKIGLIGHNKDNTSYYLKLFPQWGSVAVPNFRGLSSTQMRKAYFSNASIAWLNDCDGHLEGDNERDSLVSSGVRDFLLDFAKTPAYDYILGEYEHVLEYKTSWACAPYAPTFVTVDAVVHQSGHVLVVERGARPGKGLLALPGGFLNQNEKILDAMLRELREETLLKVPTPVLRGSVKESEVFDDPNRSSRGRTITHAFLIDLEPNKVLPKVKGADDAAKAFWMPLADVRTEDFFEDHADIIQTMIDRL